MELLPKAWRVLSDVSDSELLEAKPYVLQALQTAQHIQICMGALGADGDIDLQMSRCSLKPSNGMSDSWIWIGQVLQGRICILHS